MPDRLPSVESFTGMLDEVRILWAQLDEAMARDRRGDAGGRPVGKPSSGGSLVNADVEAVSIRLATDIPYVDAAARRILSEVTGTSVRTVPVMLGLLPSVYVRLRGRGEGRAMAELATAAEDWQHQLRRAIGLIRVGGRLGVYTCPRHDEPRTPLRKDPDSGRLHESIVEGWYARAVAAGQLPEAVRWTHAETVRCDHCGQTWSGIVQLRLLARELAG